MGCLMSWKAPETNCLHHGAHQPSRQRKPVTANSDWHETHGRWAGSASMQGLFGRHLPALYCEPGWPIDWKCHRALSLSRKSLARSDIKNESWACRLWLLKRLQEGNYQSPWYIFIKGDLRTLYPHCLWEASSLLPHSSADNQRGTKLGIYGLLRTAFGFNLHEDIQFHFESEVLLSQKFKAKHCHKSLSSSPWKTCRSSL